MKTLEYSSRSISRKQEMRVYTMSALGLSLSKDHKRLSQMALQSEKTLTVLGFVSIWPCDQLATCPGCHPAFAQRKLPQTPRTLNIGRYRKWMDGCFRS